MVKSDLRLGFPRASQASQYSPSLKVLFDTPHFIEASKTKMGIRAVHPARKNKANTPIINLRWEVENLMFQKI